MEAVCFPLGFGLSPADAFSIRKLFSKLSLRLRYLLVLGGHEENGLGASSAADGENSAAAGPDANRQSDQG